MGKFMKNCAIIAVILIIVGGAIALIAGSVVGTQVMSQLITENSDGKINLSIPFIETKNGTIFKVFGEDSAIYDINIDDDIIFNNRFSIFNESMAKTSMGTDIYDLKVEVGGCSFKVKESGDDEIWVEANGIGKIQAYVDNGVLYILSKPLDGKVSLGNFSGADITMYVPGDFAFATVDINLGAGELVYEDLKTGTATVEIGAGEVVLKDLEADSLTAKVGAGEIVLEDMKVGSLRSEVGMGNLEADGKVSGDVSVSCAMGNVTMKLDDAQDNFNYKISCAMGNVEIGGHEYSGLAQEKDINNNASKDMKIDCSMGNVEVDF